MSENKNAKKHVVLSMAQRLEIIDHLEAGVLPECISTMYGVHTKTISRIKQKSEEIRRFCEGNEKAAKRKTNKKATYKDLEAHLYAWFLERRAVGDPINDLLMREKAAQLNQELGGPSSFKSSRGWLFKFKDRHGILQPNTHGERKEVNEEAAVKIVTDLTQLLEDKSIKFNNLYNMSETGLAWKCLPRRTLVHAAEKQVDVRKMKKDRVTVGFCVNATGTHKLPLIFIHKYATPRALKYCQNYLPVIYKAQKNARMDRRLFEEWYQRDFKPAVKDDQLKNGTIGKVVLLVEKCRAHNLPSYVLEDDYFKIMFLPPSTTSAVQPMDQGIIGKVKRHFRHAILREMLKLPGGVTEFFVNYDIKDCIFILNEAWMSITSKNIHDSWGRILKHAAEAQFRYNANMIKNVPRTTNNLQELLEGIVQDKIHPNEVSEWLELCDKVEKDMAENRSEGEEEKEEGNDLETTYEEEEKEEDEKMLQRLLLWSKKQPEFIQMQARSLKSYFDQK